jgi:hypothetical protein
MSKANKKPCTEEKRIKISKAHLKWHSDHPGARAGENNPMWKRPVSDDHRKNMQKANGGKNNGMFGKKQSGESKKKNALSQRRTWVRKALSFNNDKRPRWIKAFLKTNSILLHQLSESFKKVVLA